VSEYSRRWLLDGGYFDQVSVVSPGVDTRVFHPGAEPRRHRIAYMPRKHPELASRLRDRLAGPVEWCPIDNATEERTAETLRTSTIFLNLGRREGFGLPPIEAMASGCVVCGFASEGMTDYTTAENGLWARENDVEGCVRALEGALAAVADPDWHARLTAAGRATAERYSLTAFEDAMAAYVRALL
jgi:glycosyltransferase involved in cell wall biosynthesis